jgi:arylsulfatase A-like enzyme
MLYEGGIRVPMMLRWPGQLPSGTTSALPIQGSDWFPTVLEAAGVTTEVPAELDGVSLLAALRGERDLSERTLGWHFPAYLEPYGNSEEPWRTTPAGALRKGRYKLLEFFEEGQRELYDLEADLGETQDLSAERPELLESLQGELDAWRARTGAVVPRERNPEFSAPKEAR